MKLRLAPANLASHLHRPLRFGSMWRGHELLLRVLQIAVIVWLAVAGARIVAHGVSYGAQALVGLFS